MSHILQNKSPVFLACRKISLIRCTVPYVKKLQCSNSMLTCNRFSLECHAEVWAGNIGWVTRPNSVVYLSSGVLGREVRWTGERCASLGRQDASVVGRINILTLRLLISYIYIYIYICWDLGFESHRGHGYLSVVSVVCCQVVSATSWSLVQRSPTDCAASLCVI